MDDNPVIMSCALGYRRQGKGGKRVASNEKEGKGRV